VEVSEGVARPAVAPAASGEEWARSAVPAAWGRSPDRSAEPVVDRWAARSVRSSDRSARLAADPRAARAKASALGQGPASGCCRPLALASPGSSSRSAPPVTRLARRRRPGTPGVSRLARIVVSQHLVAEQFPGPPMAAGDSQARTARTVVTRRLSVRSNFDVTDSGRCRISTGVTSFGKEPSGSVRICAPRERAALRSGAAPGARLALQPAKTR
jgi:hypothetical protein